VEWPYLYPEVPAVAGDLVIVHRRRSSSRLSVTTREKFAFGIVGGRRGNRARDTPWPRYTGTFDWTRMLWRRTGVGGGNRPRGWGRAWGCESRKVARAYINGRRTLRFRRAVSPSSLDDTSPTPQTRFFNPLLSASTVGTKGTHADCAFRAKREPFRCCTFRRRVARFFHALFPQALIVSELGNSLHLDTLEQYSFGKNIRLTCGSLILIRASSETRVRITKWE